MKAALRGLIASALLGWGAAAWAQKPAPFAATLDFSARPVKTKLGGKVSLTLTVSAFGAVHGARVDYRFPPQVKVLKGGKPWSGDIAQGRSVKLRTTVRILEAGRYSLGATAEAPGGVQGAVLYVTASDSGVEIGREAAPL